MGSEYGDTLDLFSRLPAPSQPVPTSEEAAAALTPDKLKARRYHVLCYVATRPNGATSDEVEVALSLPHQTASARLNELARVYRLLDFCDGKDGRPLVKRPTRTGANACVYYVNDAGKRLLARAA